MRLRNIELIAEPNQQLAFRFDHLFVAGSTWRRFDDLVRDHEPHPLLVELIAVFLNLVVENKTGFAGFFGIVAQLLESNRTFCCNDRGQLHDCIIELDAALEESKAKLIVIGPPLLEGNKCGGGRNHNTGSCQDGLGLHCFLERTLPLRRRTSASGRSRLTGAAIVPACRLVVLPVGRSNTSRPGPVSRARDDAEEEL
jgi:hypothetical protein